nr:MAG TPA: hypothetical protein [Caudoviricetes sp.]
MKSIQNRILLKLMVTKLHLARLTLDKEWDESKHPRGPDGKFGKGGGQPSTNTKKNGNVRASPNGANIFSVKGFKNKQALNNHWNNHGNQYPGFTKEQYKARALELIESPVSDTVLGHIDGSGIVVRYDKKTNDFVKGRPSRGIYTMFKPDEGLKYYLERKREDIEHGGSE